MMILKNLTKTKLKLFKNQNLKLDKMSRRKKLVRNIMTRKVRNIENINKAFVEKSFYQYFIHV